MNSVAYSTNCTVFDPKGKILQVSSPSSPANRSKFDSLSSFNQIDYAKEAVKQGSTSLGLKSDSHVVSGGA